MTNENKRIIINEGTLKKSLNAPPETPRPPAPKSQTTAPSNSSDKSNGKSEKT
jgi:hypothetical protein